MAAPFVGFMVDKHWFHFGWGDYLFSFFSTVTGRLEKHWGERFPLIMNELCNNGRIRKEDVKQARKELRIIQKELKKFPPRAVIWDIERPDAVGPWGPNNENIPDDGRVPNLACCFRSEDKVDLFVLLDAAFQFALKNKADVELQSHAGKKE